MHEWSSYKDYINEESGFVDIEYTLSMLSENKKESIKEFEEYHKTIEENDFHISNAKSLTDEQLKRKLIKITDGIQANEIIKMSKANRNQIINKLREAGFTIGQLERITGISRGIITRAKNVQK